jgi:hypothetical protein
MRILRQPSRFRGEHGHEIDDQEWVIRGPGMRAASSRIAP